MEPKGLHPSFCSQALLARSLKSERLSCLKLWAFYSATVGRTRSYHGSPKIAAKKESKITFISFYFILSFISLIPFFYKFTDFFCLLLNQSFRLPLKGYKFFYRIWNCRILTNTHNLELLLPLEKLTPNL